MSENEYSPAVLSAVECFPANNHLEQWSPIPGPERAAVKRALACLSHPAVLTAIGGHEPLQEAVRAVGAAHAHLTRATLAGYVELGTWLLHLWERTPKGQWLRCFSDSRDPLAEPLPLSRQRAEAFMRLAREPAVLDPANWARLPQGWTVVDAILRAAKQGGQSVQALIDDGTIHPAMTRSEAASAETARRNRAAFLLDRVRIAIHCYVAYSGASHRELISFLRTSADELEGDLVWSLTEPEPLDIAV